MNNFIKNSKKEYIERIKPIINKINKAGKIGIFGANCPAIIINKIMNGYPEYYVATRPIEKEINGKKVIDIDSDEFLTIDAIILSSLSNQAQQLKILKEKKYTGIVYSLPDMAHLSTFMQNCSWMTRPADTLFGKHTNNAALIMGNGPSLNPETISKLKNKNILKFGCNGILAAKQKIDLDYYFLLDQFSVNTWEDKISNLNCEVLAPAHLSTSISKMKAPINPIFFPACYRTKNPTLEIDDLLINGAETSHTVASIMLQFAGFMRCNPIYLIGIDLNYKSDQKYFTNDYHPVGTKQYEPDKIDFFTNEMITGIQRVTDSLHRKGITIFNCSQNSLLNDTGITEYYDINNI